MNWMQTTVISASIAISAAVATLAVLGGLRSIEREVSYIYETAPTYEPSSFECAVERDADGRVFLPTFPVEEDTIASSTKLKVVCSPS